MAKVFYIDDDKEQIELYGFAFKTYASDLEFVSENDPQKALREVGDIKPDIILLDMIMPDMSGIDVLTTLKHNSIAENIPVVVFTNSSQHNLASICEELGAEKVWIKSNMVPKEVVAKTKEVLDKNIA